MEELKHSKQKLFAFRNFLTLNHIFIENIEILDKILSSAFVIFNHMDFSNEEDNEELFKYYDKLFNDSKEYYLNLLEQNKNETLSKF